MERDEIYELLGEVFRHYPNFDISEKAVDRHLEFLSDMPLEVALRNVRMHVKDSVYPPKIAEIRAGWNNYAERMAKAAQQHIAEQEERRKHVVPPSQEVRGQIAALKQRMAAKQSGS
ncbi:hypothetical protein B9G55_01330 [Saccharibacillus sp. O16]|nr:hypothetical protein B9G55_01330 [Saccharibacillus sp. O16]